MASSSTRQRRQLPSSSDLPAPGRGYSKMDKGSNDNNNRGKSREEEKGGLGWVLGVLMGLGMLRYMSATSNIIHDCDEVFNYWEPLHFLLYESGFQTWEYSSQFALRSYLYLNFHQLVGVPASWFFSLLGGHHPNPKVRVFYAVRLFLGAISVLADTTLVVALSRKYGKRLASYALAMLCLTSGCFFASTSFLPSSFSMYAMSLSSGFFLLGKYASAIAIASVGVLLGWPFSILAFLPITLYSLAKRFKPTFIAGTVTSAALLGLSVLADYHYYGRLTSSVLNLLLYNVKGGGESHLYGVEGPLFYLRNGFNNFNVCFILALLLPLIFPIARRKYGPDLLIVVSSLYIWLGFMSLQPHKEERFLYPIYPLVCVAASAVIESLPYLFQNTYDPDNSSVLVTMAKILRPVVLSLILGASHARTFSLVNGYSAPLEVYKILDHYDDAGTGSVLCVGSEWHRYPSSFFVPDYVGQIRWIDDGFQGLLPFPFNSTLGGTAVAPAYFNNKNKASPEQYLQDIEACTFLVELQLNRPYLTRGSDLSTWEPIAALPYLDREVSPPLYRSFFIPYLWQQKNVFGLYKLFKRAPSEI